MAKEFADQISREKCRSGGKWAITLLVHSLVKSARENFYGQKIEADYVTMIISHL